MHMSNGTCYCKLPILEACLLRFLFANDAHLSASHFNPAVHSPPPFNLVKIEIQKTVQFPVPQSVPHTRQKAETSHKLEGE